MAEVTGTRKARDFINRDILYSWYLQRDGKRLHASSAEHIMGYVRFLVQGQNPGDPVRWLYFHPNQEFKQLDETTWERMELYQNSPDAPAIARKFDRMATELMKEIQSELGKGWKVESINISSWVEVKFSAQLQWREAPVEVSAEGDSLGEAVMYARRVTCIDPDYYARNHYLPGVTIDSMIEESQKSAPADSSS